MNTAFDTTTKLTDTISDHFAGDLQGKRIAVWGCTDINGDWDEATTKTVDWLLAQGVEVAIHDSTLSANDIATQFGDHVSAPVKQWDAVKSADAVIVCSDLACYCSIDAGRLAWSLTERVLFDVHGTINRDSLQYSSFAHYVLSKSSTDESGVTMSVRIDSAFPSTQNQGETFFANAG